MRTAIAWTVLSTVIVAAALVDEYKSSTINNNIVEKITIFNEIYEVIINIYNNLNKDKYLFIRKSLLIIYENIRTIIIKYNGFQ